MTLVIRSMSKPRFSESRNEEPKEEQTIILNKYEENSTKNHRLS